jgi:hypothetical protein
MVWPLGGIDLCPEGDSMPHRAIAAAAATSALLIGTALPAAATEPTHTTHRPTESPAYTERPTCDQFGLKTLIESADGGSTENQIAFGVVHSGETAGNPEGSFLDVSLRQEFFDQLVIKVVVLTGESGAVAIYDEPTFEGDLWVSLHVGDGGRLETIKHWVACGEKIKESPKPTPTETEPTAEPSPTETKPTTESTLTKSPKPVPTELPAGSSTSTGGAPWAVFGLAAVSALVAAGAGAVIGGRREPNRV